MLCTDVLHVGLVAVLTSAWQLHWRAVLQLLVPPGIPIQRVDEDGVMLERMLSSNLSAPRCGGQVV